jgi:hypothetical protein
MQSKQNYFSNNIKRVFQQGFYFFSNLQIAFTAGFESEGQAQAIRVLPSFKRIALRP